MPGHISSMGEGIAGVDSALDERFAKSYEAWWLWVKGPAWNFSGAELEAQFFHFG